MLQELRHLDEALDQLHDPAAGTLHPGALPVAAAGALPGVLTRLKGERPGLRIGLHEGRTEDLLPLLAAGGLDPVVGHPYAPDGVEREPPWDEPIFLLARAGPPSSTPPPLTTPGRWTGGSWRCRSSPSGSARTSARCWRNWGWTAPGRSGLVRPHP